MSKRELKSQEKELLENGNVYKFAMLLHEFYTEECERGGLTRKNIQRSYNAYCEYSDGIFIFRQNNGDKAYFDTNMECIGYKDY